MRKIKLTVKYRVPSWNFCNHDVFTEDDMGSKELCRFCIKTKKGYRCVLHDTDLSSDARRVYKNEACIDASAGFAITADEPVPEGPVVDPKFIMRETLDIYNKTLNDLLNQGYPRQMAESIARKYILEDK